MVEFNIEQCELIADKILQDLNINLDQVAPNVKSSSDFLSKLKLCLIDKITSNASLWTELQTTVMSKGIVLVQQPTGTVVKKQLDSVNKAESAELFFAVAVKKVKLEFQLPDGLETKIAQQLNIGESQTKRDQLLRDVARTAYRLKFKHNLQSFMFSKFFAKAEAVAIRQLNTHYRRLLTGLQVGQYVTLGIIANTNSYEIAVVLADGLVLSQQKFDSQDFNSTVLQDLCSLYSVKYIAWCPQYATAALQKVINVLVGKGLNQGVVASNGLHYQHCQNKYTLPTLIARRLQQPLYELASISFTELELENFSIVADIIEPQLERARLEALEDYKISYSHLTKELLLLLPDMTQTLADLIIHNSNIKEPTKWQEIPGITPTKFNLLNSILREDLSNLVLKPPRVNLKTLTVGELLPGTVSNICAFGVFVELGRGHSGLIHKSKLQGFKFAVGDKIWVRVANIDYAKKHINFTLPLLNQDIKQQEPNLSKIAPKSHFAKQLAAAVNKTEICE